MPAAITRKQSFSVAADPQESVVDRQEAIKRKLVVSYSNYLPPIIIVTLILLGWYIDTILFFILLRNEGNVWTKQKLGLVKAARLTSYSIGLMIKYIKY